MSKGARSNKETVKVSFENSITSANMGFWECYEAYQNACQMVSRHETLYSLSQGLSGQIVREYHSCLVIKNDYAERLITHVLNDLKSGCRLLDRENLETFGEELAQDVARTDIILRALENHHDFLAPVFRF